MSWSFGDPVDAGFWARRGALAPAFSAIGFGPAASRSVVTIGLLFGAPALLMATRADHCPCCSRPFADPPSVPDPAAPG